MAFCYLQPALWLWLLLNGQFVYAAFWTVTSAYMEVQTISTYTYGSTTSQYTFTHIASVKPGATPTGRPYSSSVTERTYADIQLTFAYYSTGAFAASDLVPTRTGTEPYPFETEANKLYYMDVTYTPPATCQTTFTVTTSELVIIPLDVTNQVTAYSTKVPSVTGTGRPWETLFLRSGAAPFQSSTAWAYSRWVAQCKQPSSSLENPKSGSGSNIRVCSWYSGCTSLQTWVIIIAAILPSLFVLGFLESYIWFRRLMLGKGCLRAGTICWILISLWVACFTRSQSRRSPEDQKLLREKWSKIGGGTAFKLWWKWGFKHRYPEELLGKYSRNTVGVENPAVAAAAPAMQQTHGQPPPPGGQGGFGAPPPGQTQSMYGHPPPGQPVYGSPPPGQQGYAPPPPGQQPIYGSPPPGQQGYAPPPQGQQPIYGPPPPGQQQQQGYAPPPPGHQSWGPVPPNQPHQPGQQFAPAQPPYHFIPPPGPYYPQNQNQHPNQNPNQPFNQNQRTVSISSAGVPPPHSVSPVSPTPPHSELQGQGPPVRYELGKEGPTVVETETRTRGSPQPQPPQPPQGGAPPGPGQGQGLGR